MNNIHSYQDTIDLPDSGGLRHVENYSGSTSSAYDEVSPHMHNSTPGSNDSAYEKNNQSTISSKKSKNSNLSSDDNLNLTVDALEKTLTEDKTTKIKEIITLISNLSDTEKLLLQLQFPLTDLENATFESSLNIGFNNVDMIGSSTIMEQEEASKWVMSHLEENKSTCLQKQEVYEDYKSYCMTYNIKCLSTADFGKVMRKNFPNVKARRLGARGQSRYCYSGLRNRQETQSPMLKDVGMILESNENIDEYRKRDNNNANSEVESYSSTLPSNNDLSNVPEYELSPNILIDSAHVLLEFIKKVGVSKNIMSLKQAVKHLLTNNQVDLRSPYATRLCSVFQQSDNNKPYVANKYSNEPVFNTIKKEETLISPCSVTPQRSSTASPQNQKRRDMFNSPVPNKIIYCDLPKLQSDNSPIHTPQNPNRSNFSYNQPYYHQSIPPNMIPMPHHVALPMNSLRQDMSPASMISNGAQPKPFAYSTPVKNVSNIEIPQLNSPLLDNNPLTSKKLELNKYLNPASSISSNLTSVPDNNSKLNLYYSPHDRSRSFTSTAYNNQELRRPQNNSYMNTSSIDLFRTVDSPMSMNTDYVHQPSQEFQDLEDIDTCQSRFIDDGRSEINFQTSPTHSINNDNNYSMGSSNFCSLTSPMKNDKPYLNTPDNSPNRNDPDVEDSSNCSQISIKRENFLSITKPGSKTLNYSSCFPANSIPDYLYGADRNCFFNHHFNINRSSDESNVTSTTSIGITDPDGHPSTTMRQNFIYNK